MTYQKPTIGDIGKAEEVILGMKPHQFSPTDSPIFRPEVGGVYETEE